MGVEVPSPLIPYEIPGKTWGTETVLAVTDHYSLKCLKMRAGAVGPLQHHVTKFESFVVASGRVAVTHDDGTGKGLVTVECGPGEGFTIPPGATHRVSALEESVLFEASNPIFDDRVDDSELYP